MTKCVITLKSGEEILSELNVDSSLDLNTFELINLLIKLGKWNSFLQNLEKSLKKRPISRVNFNTIMNQGMLISNASIHNLKDRFTDLGDIFPEETDEFKYSDFPVLFISNYKTEGGNNIRFGIYKNPNGKLTYVVDRKSLEYFSNYLRLYKSIVSDNIIDKIEENDKKFLQKVIDSTEGIKDMSSLLLDFLKNKDKYSGIYIDGESSYTKLENICRGLLGLTKIRQYNSTIINNISEKIDYTNNYTSGKISTDVLLKLIEEGSPDLWNVLKLHFGDDYDKLKKFFNKTVGENLEKLKNSGLFNDLSDNDNSKSSWEMLYNYLIKSDPNFNFNFEKYSRGVISVKKKYLTLESRFGFNRIEDLNLDIEYYNGQYISKIPRTNDKEEDKYVVTTMFPTKKSLISGQYRTKLECKDKIDSWEKIYGSYFLYTNRTDDTDNTVYDADSNLQKGDVIKVLDVSYLIESLNKDEIFKKMIEDKKISSSIDLEKKLKIFNRPQLLNALSLIEQADIIEDRDKSAANIIYENLNTPEKAYLFLQLVDLDLIGSNDIQSLIILSQKLRDLDKYKYFYVKSTYEHEDGRKNVSLVRFVPNVLNSEEDPNRFLSIYNIFDAFSRTLCSKLRIHLDIAPFEILKLHVADLGKNPELINKNSKAFILDGEDGYPIVFINSSTASVEDFIHEYSHIFLAYLKSNKDKVNIYYELLSDVWESASEALISSILEKYKNYPNIMKAEELFVEQFGEWASGSGKDLFSKKVLEELEEYKKLIDSNNKAFDIQDLSTKRLSKLVLFNNEINAFISDKDNTIAKEVFKDFKILRLKIEWMRLLIEKENVEEKCDS